MRPASRTSTRAVLLGGMIWVQWPPSGAWAIGVLVGIKVMFLGATMITLGSAARALAVEAGRAA